MKLPNCFLTEMNPNTNRQLPNKAAIAKAGVGLTVAIVLVLLLIPTPKPLGVKVAQAQSDTPPDRSSTLDERGTDFVPNRAILSPSVVAASSRSFSASQIVKKDGAPGSRSGEVLPLGTTIKASLVNTALSSDGNSPVIAVIDEDGSFGSSVFIPSGTKIYGQATLDEASRRLQIRFHTLVFDDGSQASFSALALQPDGSSGLAGIYHSGNVTQQVGRFGGNLIGGIASGMKERESGGWSGPIEPGSLKNGILNGLSEAASDQAQVFSNQMQSTRAYLEVSSGTAFILFFEKEFSNR